MPANNSKKPVDARDAARAQVVAMREAQAKREQRTRNIMIVALALVLVALIVVIVFVLHGRSTNSSNNAGATLGTEVPAGANADGSFSLGKDGTVGSTNAGAPVVTVYADYMCPGCGQFEEANADTLDQERQAGTVTWVMHPVATLDQLSKGTQYSTRAASAFALVADRAPSVLIAFNKALFDNQPAENTAGLSDAQIADIARQAAVPDDVAQQISDGTAMARFGGWVQSTTAAVVANKDLVMDGYTSFVTPTVTLNGEIFTGNWLDPAVLSQAIAAAKNG